MNKLILSHILSTKTAYTILISTILGACSLIHDTPLDREMNRSAGTTLAVHSLRTQSSSNSNSLGTANLDGVDFEDQIVSLQVVSTKTISENAYYTYAGSGSAPKIKILQFSGQVNSIFVANMPNTSTWKYSNILGTKIPTDGHLSPPFPMSSGISTSSTNNSPHYQNCSFSNNKFINYLGNEIQQIGVRRAIAALDVSIQNSIPTSKGEFKLIGIRMINIPKEIHLISSPDSATSPSQTPTDGYYEKIQLKSPTTPNGLDLKTYNNLTRTFSTPIKLEVRTPHLITPRIYLPENFPADTSHNTYLIVSLSRTHTLNGSPITEYKTIQVAIGEIDTPEIDQNVNENNKKIRQIKRNRLYKIRIDLQRWNPEIRLTVHPIRTDWTVQDITLPTFQ